jgi:hypothetical protein
VAWIVMAMKVSMVLMEEVIEESSLHTVHDPLCHCTHRINKNSRSTQVDLRLQLLIGSLWPAEPNSKKAVTFKVSS